MSRSGVTVTEWESVAAIYLPLAGAVVAGLFNGRQPRQFAACLLGILWAMPSLLAVQAINCRVGSWSFSGESPRIHSMPIECFVGWALLWGIVPQLAFPRLAIGWLATIMVAVDLVVMPLCGPLVRLGPHWLIGEVLVITVVLVPALLVARWTFDNTHLRARSAIQVVTSGMIFLYLLPEIAFALRPGAGWLPLLQEASWRRQISIQVLLLVAVPGVSAVMEFAERGNGTPIPYDPPQRLVTSGIYRYCANPMQISCVLVMVFWAGMLRNGWLLLAAALSAIYSAGIAEWDEKEDLVRRFGDAWRNYRVAVGSWQIRWRPFHDGPKARIYIAATCGPCSELRAWLAARDPLGLEIVDAEVLPSGSIRRMRYDPGDGSACVEGVRAMGRALEHLNFAWAFAGATLRLPGIWQAVQLLMDASGLGPRELISTARVN
jgi:protein-S-isoprenylcysteine O-methyltransferase Ste14